MLAKADQVNNAGLDKKFYEHYGFIDQDGRKEFPPWLSARDRLLLRLPPCRSKGRCCCGQGWQRQLSKHSRCCRRLTVQFKKLKIRKSWTVQWNCQGFSKQNQYNVSWGRPGKNCCCLQQKSQDDSTTFSSPTVGTFPNLSSVNFGTFPNLFICLIPCFKILFVCSWLVFV